MFCNIIQEEVVKTVTNDTAESIDAFLLKSSSFGNTKHDLTITMLEDMADGVCWPKPDGWSEGHYAEHFQDRFDEYMGYIDRIRNYMPGWIDRYSQNLIFKKKDGCPNQYMEQANSHVDRILCAVISSIHSATIAVPPHPLVETNVKDQWFKHFCQSVNDTLPGISENDFKFIPEKKTLTLTDFHTLGKLIEDGLTKVTTDIKSSIDQTHETSVKWGDPIQIPPYVHIWKTVGGCMERCPFCYEPCVKTDPDHGDSHQCLQHIPHCVRGKMDNRGGAVTDICSLLIASSDETYLCSGLYGCTCPNPNDHLFKDYRECYPQWDIAPDNAGESSKYWKWFVCIYKEQLMEKYGFTSLNIPEHWMKITKAQAIESLKAY